MYKCLYSWYCWAFFYMYLLVLLLSLYTSRRWIFRTFVSLPLFVQVLLRSSSFVSTSPCRLCGAVRTAEWWGKTGKTKIDEEENENKNISMMIYIKPYCCHWEMEKYQFHGKGQRIDIIRIIRKSNISFLFSFSFRYECIPLNRFNNFCVCAPFWAETDPISRMSSMLTAVQRVI